VVNIRFPGRIFTNTVEIQKKRLPVYTGGDVRPPVLTGADLRKLDEGLALYLILRDYMKEIGAVAGGWTNQLAWGSDARGVPLTTADIAEALFNSTEDHTGRKAVVPFATENDIQGLLTMIAHGYLTGGNPTLFMDFRKVYEPWEIERNAASLGLDLGPYRETPWLNRGFVDGNNSGSASLDYAREAFLFKAVKSYFPGGGFSVFAARPDGWDIPISAGCSPWSRTRSRARNCPRPWPNASVMLRITLGRIPS
jgi:hypothetical protein